MDKNKYDIFISYRRQDADSYAYMLYRDLTSSGYSVFYDHSSLGAGDFVSNILKAIDHCTDVIILLSKEALGHRIYEQTDVLRMEIAYAIKSKKRIIGIMLSGFDTFPTDLPEDIKALPYINCLFSKIEYYDAMLERLLSGQFLLSVPSNIAEVQTTHTEYPIDEMLHKWGEKYPVEKKQQYMKFLMDIMHEFNSSQECMRLYNYLDLSFRNRGLCEPPAYPGIIPTDFATYLSFFETMYIIIATKTLDMSLVDPVLRFRFFAACNNPNVQDSELLALGYQYPNIFKLYDYWSEYIRQDHIKSGSTANLSSEYPQYERDLHITYHLYQLAQQPQIPQEIRFLNKDFRRIDVVLQLLNASHQQMFLDFQAEVLNEIPNVIEQNLFEPLTKEEVNHSLEHDLCFAAFSDGKPVALLSCIPAPMEAQNILADLEGYKEIPAKDVLVIDCILVHKDYRGYGLQRAFLQLSGFIADKHDSKHICAVVAPDNIHSSSNFFKSGFAFICRQAKYHSTRDYYVKQILSDDIATANMEAKPHS